MLVVSKNDPSKKITYCKNTMKGRIAAMPSNLLFLMSLQTESCCKTVVVRGWVVFAPLLLQGCWA